MRGLLRSVAAEGWPVHLVKLSGKLAAPDTHRQNAIAEGKAVIKGQPAVKRWVVGGHSMGASVAARFVYDEPKQFRGLILVGTTLFALAISPLAAAFALRQARS